jgi:hypothetical protein
MDSAGWPVDLPRARVLEIGHRRHRRLTAPSGVVLFVCMFLPAMKSCGSAAVYPTELPFYCHPYVYGLALAIASLAVTERAVRRAVVMMRVVAWSAVAGGIATIVQSRGLGGAALIALGGALVAVIGVRGAFERRIAITGIVVSVLCILWFGLWAGSGGALVGIYLSLAASIFLLAGCLLWLSEL